MRLGPNCTAGNINQVWPQHCMHCTMLYNSGFNRKLMQKAHKMEGHTYTHTHTHNSRIQFKKFLNFPFLASEMKMNKIEIRSDTPGAVSLGGWPL